MQSAHVLKRCFATAIATSVRTDVVPVFRGVVGWPNKSIIERLIKSPIMVRTSASLSSLGVAPGNKNNRPRITSAIDFIGPSCIAVYYPLEAP
jgi:hypothetical protein